MADRPGRGRLDPTGKRALFEAPVQAPDDRLSAAAPEGRAALFSGGSARPGTVVVDCSGCGVRSRVSLLDVGLRLAQLSVWLPGRSHNRRMRCPSCDRREWCRIDWLG